MEQIHQRQLFPGEVTLLPQDPVVPPQLDLEEGLELFNDVVVSRDTSTAAGVSGSLR
jgi:hypothetical protein